MEAAENNESAERKQNWDFALNKEVNARSSTIIYSLNLQSFGE